MNRMFQRKLLWCYGLGRNLDSDRSKRDYHDHGADALIERVNPAGYVNAIDSHFLKHLLMACCSFFS